MGILHDDNDPEPGTPQPCKNCGREECRATDLFDVVTKHFDAMKRATDPATRRQNQRAWKAALREWNPVHKSCIPHWVDWRAEALQLRSRVAELEQRLAAWEEHECL